MWCDVVVLAALLHLVFSDVFEEISGTLWELSGNFQTRTVPVDGSHSLSQSSVRSGLRSACSGGKRTSSGCHKLNCECAVDKVGRKAGR